MKSLGLMPALVLMLSIPNALASECTLTTNAYFKGDETTFVKTTRVFQLNAQGEGRFETSYSEKGADSFTTGGASDDVEFLNDTLTAPQFGSIWIEVDSKSVDIQDNESGAWDSKSEKFSFTSEVEARVNEGGEGVGDLRIDRVATVQCSVF